MLKGREVIRTIEGANPTFPEYPLEPGDLLMQTSSGSFYKLAPGLSVGGFVLDDFELTNYTIPAEFVQHGPHDYRLVGKKRRQRTLAVR